MGQVTCRGHSQLLSINATASKFGISRTVLATDEQAAKMMFPE